MTEAALADWSTAPIDPRLGAALAFVEKLTLYPQQLGVEDVAKLCRAGVKGDAVLDLIIICAGFNIIDRVADAFDFETPPTGEFVKGAWFLLRFGYRLCSGLRLSRCPRMRPNGRLDFYEDGMNRLREKVLSGPGALAPRLRRAACELTYLPEPLGTYVGKVAHRAYTVTDEDILEVRKAHYSEDQLFEATISAALGAGLVRFRSGIVAFRVSQQAAD
jgi:hypothetical protein